MNQKNQNNQNIQGFHPIASTNAKILILGSMPSVESLNQQQYYAHPRNSFWPIMLALLGSQRFKIDNPELPDYPARIKLLKKHHIAVWDVLQSCYRPGSLDSSIEQDSLKTNDFAKFFNKHKQVNCIFFNGSKAQQLYKRYVLPKLAEPFRNYKLTRLPSSSPAMAMLSRQQKFEQWKQALVGLKQIA